MRQLSRFLRAFCTTAACAKMMQHQQAWLVRTLSKQFGYYALQLGVVADFAEAWKTCPIQSHFVIADAPFEQVSAVVEFQELPVASKRIDLMVMPYVLELVDDPYAVLREVDRVLIADGRLIIMGFHPANAWRGRLFGQQHSQVEALSLFGAGRVVDALQTLGYEIQQVDFYPNTGWRRWLPWLDTPFSQGYALLAHKKTSRIKLIGLRDGWRWQSLLPQLAKRNLTNKVHCEKS